MSEQEVYKRTTLDIPGIVVAVVIGIIGLCATVWVALHTPAQIENNLKTWMDKGIVVGLCILAFGGGYWLSRRRSASKVIANTIEKTKVDEQLKLLQEELEKIAKDREEKNDEISKLKAKPVPFFDRWENITGIRYGHIDYSPLLYHDTQGDPLGIGITILKRIFQKNGFVHAGEKMHWDEIEKLLNEKDPDNPKKHLIDIIATPIFETNDRSQKIGFTSPIYYSEIGIYISKTSKILGKLNPPMDFDTAIATIKGYQDKIKFCVIEGELSERMMTKYFSEVSKSGKYVRYKSINVGIPELLGKVYSGDSDVAFVETYQADLLTKYNDKLINLLRPKELLYPVGFALRKEDYVLRRYINLKLLELDLYSEDGNGILGLIKEELGNIQNFYKGLKTDTEKIDKVKKYFIREYDAAEINSSNILRLRSPSTNS